jgi:Yip1-like protein
LELKTQKDYDMLATFLRRLVGAALLDTATYEEVEADTTATTQALAVVVFSSLAAGIGVKGAEGSSATLHFFFSASIIALLTWAAWALVTFEVGSRLLPTPETRVNPGELLRTLGFAATPGLIQVLGVFPGVKVPVLVVAIAWALAASVVAVRQALDYESTGRAIAVCSVGGALSLVFAVVLGLVFGPTLSGLG